MSSIRTYETMDAVREKTGETVRARKAFRVLNKQGLHARPAAAFVKTASRFACDVVVEKDGEKVNGKSILGLLLLAAKRGSQLTVHAHGRDAFLALAELQMLFERRFGEQESNAMSDDECERDGPTGDRGGHKRPSARSALAPGAGIVPLPINLNVYENYSGC